MTSAQEIPFEQIQDWVRTESAKNRPMKEIVAELSARDDVSVLSAHESPEVRHQKIVDFIAKAKRTTSPFQIHLQG